MSTFSVRAQEYDPALPDCPARRAPIWHRRANTIGANDRILNTPAIDASRDRTHSGHFLSETVKCFRDKQPSTALAEHRSSLLHSMWRGRVTQYRQLVHPAAIVIIEAGQAPADVPDCEAAIMSETHWITPLGSRIDGDIKHSMRTTPRAVWSYLLTQPPWRDRPAVQRDTRAPSVFMTVRHHKPR